MVEYLGQAHVGGLAGVSRRLRDLDRMMLGLSPGPYLMVLGAEVSEAATIRARSRQFSFAAYRPSRLWGALRSSTETNKCLRDPRILLVPVAQIPGSYAM